MHDSAERPNAGTVGSPIAGDTNFTETVGQDDLCKNECPTSTLNGTDEYNLARCAADFDFVIDSSRDGDGADEEIDSESTWGPTIPADSRYQLGRLYADGGLSRVWIARLQFESQGRAQANPVEHSENPKARRRFRNEAQITGQLEHRILFRCMSFVRPAKIRSLLHDAFGQGNDACKACDEYHASLSAVSIAT
jgi:hypothetical protein